MKNHFRILIWIQIISTDVFRAIYQHTTCFEKNLESLSSTITCWYQIYFIQHRDDSSLRQGCVTWMQWSLLDVHKKKRSTHLRVCGASMVYGLHARSSISWCSLCLHGDASQNLPFISDGFLWCAGSVFCMRVTQWWLQNIFTHIQYFTVNHYVIFQNL